MGFLKVSSYIIYVSMPRARRRQQDASQRPRWSIGCDGRKQTKAPRIENPTVFRQPAGGGSDVVEGEANKNPANKLRFRGLSRSESRDVYIILLSNYTVGAFRIFSSGRTRLSRYSGVVFPPIGIHCTVCSVTLPESLFCYGIINRSEMDSSLINALFWDFR